MTYEEYLDEVTTLIFEKYNVAEKDAVKMVVVAQDHEFFVAHDEDESLRTVEQAHKDAKALFERRAAKGRPPAKVDARAPKTPKEPEDE
ncbi:hypothetical protein IP91_04904 [Pseudoduganella lurida]|uniref:Uncharacterized protein n=1 Tax=Pseudoduganella lurida TaxID=1036180 RepID=A0A562QVY5_9BURK|nr:hypothetical protein [Pseudoduganella lurida]TWI60939.1 hypothetical protein IP91_04904 [Pseudoduganella lurida]